LLIGSPDGLRQLEGRLGRLTGNNSPCLRELLDASEDLEFLRIGAHPCRTGKELWKMGPLLRRLDALEINAGELSQAGRVHRRAKENGLPVVAGSDAHHWLQLGRVYNLLPEGQGSDVKSIRKAVIEKKTSWRKESYFPCSFLTRKKTVSQHIAND
jgi:hypothetical protein